MKAGVCWTRALWVGALGFLLLAGCKPTSTALANPSPPTDLGEGLLSQTVATGSGKEAKKGDKVSVHYVGKLDDGTIFDSSRERNRPFTFRLGAGQVITGWDLGVVGMREGEKRNLTIPAKLGYGTSSVGKIPANATLHFEVELIEVW